MPSFGFIILSHRAPAQLHRLVRTLDQLYGRPAIACHHDFSQATLDVGSFAENVRFVQPSVRTGWGKWSLVEATLRGLELLYRSADPDFFFLISAADYPAADAGQVLRDLEESRADYWIDAFNLREALQGREEEHEPHLSHHRSPANIALARERYLRAHAKIPVVRFRPPAFSTTVQRYPRLGMRTIALPVDAPLSPFRTGYDCFVGSQWFTGTRKAARKLMAPSSDDLRLQRHLRNRVVPDECYVQTVLCNDGSLLGSRRTHRLAFWHGGGAHPAEVEMDDIPVVEDQRPHFVRKIGADGAVPDALDRMLGLTVTAQS